jgi:hypothetical protein
VSPALGCIQLLAWIGRKNLLAHNVIPFLAPVGSPACVTLTHDISIPIRREDMN